MPTIQEQIQIIKDRYSPQLEDLKKRAQRLVDDYEKPSDGGAAIGIDFKIDWKDEDIIFDVPSVTMRSTTISLDLPEVFSERQTIIFHTPSVRMVDRKVGEYPEFHGPFKIEWKPIIVSVPEPFLEEQKIIFDLPSVKMKRQDIKLDLPEFKMETVKWDLKLPQITVVNVRAETAKLKEAGEQLKSEGDSIGSRMRAEIEAVIGGMKAAGAQGRSGAKNEVAAGYDRAIAKLKSSIDELVAKGIDPIKVPTDGGDINLRKQLTELIAQREATLGKIDRDTADLPLAA
ncbi:MULTISPECIES: hypothetical protein [Bradyrhizobium]|uniref:hypothetical protein n=1 Tax=Bradyrhizobium TaxID=374 RepID=UPI000576F107|nr:hypothetical protein [Bradyrhizobium sp. CCBAU 15544]